MRYAEFESEFPEFLKSVTPELRRQWKKRDKVPVSAVTEARSSVTKVVSVTVEGVTKPETLQVSVTSPAPALQVAIPSAEDGHPEFDIMSDGLARGFPGDTWQRANRTCHAIRRMAEKKKGGIHEGTKLAKKWIADWEKSPSLETLRGMN